MCQFDALTKYIPLIEQDNIGVWIVDKKDDGTFIQMPYVKYSEITVMFIEEVYDFIDEHED